ncbi:TAXI family TRAP transporter solute-binding subunit [Phreatobacter aquaticus]|uniref:TAXI family TRAP transporter solute-binding subunit n=1 Tax=Phreatobacter aquaticus TaxID=2570229 RepID=A0A4D7QHU2_9HYPH|nr:TAXI family TRAP transporter solute-binding subunit [Phreatobacter aquaticus]QCK86281.1 TAXI family TRAP transporter solute-binding subunit [Phreatobacter aquaticus]
MLKRIVAAVGLVVLAATGASAQTIEWRGGSIGGGWYTIVSGAAKLLEDKVPGLTVKAVPGGGAANPIAVQQGQAQLAMSIDIFASMAAGATGTYQGRPVSDKLRMIGQSFGDTPFHFIRAPGQTMDIATLFKEGRNIRFGGASNGATDEIALRWLLAHYGQTYDSLRARGWRFTLAAYADLASAYRDNQIDYAFFALGLPGSAVVDMATGRDGELLDIPQDVLDGFKQRHGMGSGSIPAATYPRFQGSRGAVKTLVMATTLITSADVPDDVIYRVTKAICENVAELPRIHSSLADYRCETAVRDRPVPVHPGALRYYRERGFAPN